MLKMITFSFLFLFLLVISLLSFLYSGIKIDSFSFSNILVSQFYIKIDKKLILNIENIEYKSNKQSSGNSIEEIKKNIELLPKALKIFQNINIDKLKINDDEFKIILDDEILYLDNKYINLSSKIDIASKQIVFDLYSLYLKDLEVLFEGSVKIDYFNEKLNYIGKSYYQDIQTNVNLEMTKEKAKFYLSSEPFKSLKFLKKFLQLDEVAEAWMYDNVEGDIKLQEFYGEYDIKNNQILENTLQGKAQIDKAKIRFHNEVDVVNTKSLDISYKNDELHFDLIEPIFKDKKLDGSFVTIHDLTSQEKGQVDVFIKANSKLDKDVLDILKAYKINLPLIQKTGNTQASLLMKFPYEASKEMTTYGEFSLSDAQIAINNFVFDSKNAQVVLNDTIVEIKNSDFKYKNMIDAVVNLDLDTKTLKAQGDANIKSFLIKKDKDEIVNIKDKKTNLDMNFDKQVDILLKDLQTDIKVSDLIYVNINDLSKIYPYSKLLKDNSIKEGNIALQIKDEKNINFEGFVKGLELPLQKNDVMIDSLDIIGKIENSKVKISSKNEEIKIEIADKTDISLHNLDVILDSKIKDKSLNQDMNINLVNSKLKIENDIYNLENAKITIKNKLVSFEANVKDLNLPIRKNSNEIKNLTLIGTIKNGETFIKTKNEDLKLELKKDITTLYIDGYNLYYTTSNDEKEEENKDKKIDIKGKNSTIILNDKYKFLTDNFEIRVREDSKYIGLNYKETNITLKESKDKKVDIFTSNLNDEYINTIFDKHIFKGGSFIFHANGTMNDLNGKLIIDNCNIENLAVLNNLLMFIHTSPALINPLLAIPSVVGMATNDGFNLFAYKIVNGNLEFNYNKQNEILEIKRLVTVGNGIDFDGKGKLDLNTMLLTSNIKLIFLKDYSKIVGAIPVINYVLLGDNNRVETEVNLNRKLEDPEVSTNLTKDTLSVPMNIGKRIINSPSALFDFIKGIGSKEEEKK